MIAYSGKYRVNDKEFVTTVEMSWNQAWNGTEQKRYWKIEEGKLVIRRRPYRVRTSQVGQWFSRVVWERDK